MRKEFILTEAARMIPLVRRILRETREHRANISRIARLLDRFDIDNEQKARLIQDRESHANGLRNCLSEAKGLGVSITEGIRCEAWFPFLHQWGGKQGDRKLRLAYFVYNDAQPMIQRWIFDGWPNDHKPIAKSWWNIHRPTSPTKEVVAAKS